MIAVDLKAELKELKLQFNHWQKIEGDAKAQMEYLIDRIEVLEQDLEEAEENATMC